MTLADKAISYGIVFSVIMAFGFELPIFYNFGVGLSLGASLMYFLLLFQLYKKNLREELFKISKEKNEQ